MTATSKAAKTTRFKTRVVFLPLLLSVLLGSCTSSMEDQKDEDQVTQSKVSEVSQELSSKEQTKKEVNEIISTKLEQNGFKFEKKKNAYVRNRKDYQDEITVQANNRGDFYFHFGRNFPAVANMVAPFQSKKLFSTPDLTVWDSSMNAGPNFSEHYKIEGGWSLSPETKEEVKLQLFEFIDEFMLPWLDKFPDLKAARAKLERRPMIKVETTIQILAIDVLLNDKKAFHQELDRSMPSIENSTSHDSKDKLLAFLDDIYVQHPEFRQN
ncbi:MAG: hypothetical protein KIT34_08130 [Cyanobacteria bacterium TGS_CYA1]|nr:hypothetical protein [Cyanobacteria bacterium TGS_CYA1]